MKYKFIERLGKDGVNHGTIDVPEKDVPETLRRNPTWRIQEDEETPIQPVEFKIECPICNKTFKSEGGLGLHRRHHFKKSRS